MSTEILSELDLSLNSGSDGAPIDLLIEYFRREKQFPSLFEARLMKKRLELRLPLIQTDDFSEVPADIRAAYDQGVIEAAREAGSQYLAAGNIERAWPYFRAIGEQAPVIQAIEAFQVEGSAAEQTTAVIAIAFQEGLHPAKGLALILESQGMCRAVTSFGMFEVRQEREECIALLVRGVHREIVERMGRAIAAEEGTAPETSELNELMANRDYLFGEYDCYVDTSHVSALLPYSVEVTSEDTLALYQQLCRYGTRLSPNFRMSGEPPFANPFVDYGYYIQALRGIEVEQAIEHFREIAESLGEEYGPAPAQVLVNLLVRLRRPAEALDVSLAYLDGESAGPCPSAVQLCFLAEDFDQLKALAAEKGDLLSYTAAALTARQPGS